jgi:putative alpha-1,2-mannosidase
LGSAGVIKDVPGILQHGGMKAKITQRLLQLLDPAQMFQEVLGFQGL